MDKNYALRSAAIEGNVDKLRQALRSGADLDEIGKGNYRLRIRAEDALAGTALAAYAMSMPLLQSMPSLQEIMFQMFPMMAMTSLQLTRAGMPSLQPRMAIGAMAMTMAAMAYASMIGASRTETWGNALHYATSFGNKDAVQFLLNEKADVTIRDESSNKRTALENARVREHSDIVSMLELAEVKQAEEKRQAEAEAERQARAPNPVLLPSGKTYHGFASHKKESSHQLAMHICDVLHYRFGLQMFFDVDSLRKNKINQDVLAQAVAASCVLVVVLDKDILGSEWCQREWEYARNNNVPIVGVIDTDKFNLAQRNNIYRAFRNTDFGYVIEYRVVELASTYREVALQELAQIIQDHV